MNPQTRILAVIGLTSLVGALTAPRTANAQSIALETPAGHSSSSSHSRHHRRRLDDKVAQMAAQAAHPAAPAAAPTAPAAAATPPRAPERPREATPDPRAAAHGTPLPVRQSRPLSLAPVSATGDGWKVVFGFATIAAGLYYWKRRNAAVDPSSGPELRIVRRTPLNDRGELLVIDVAGQRMLLGVTSGSVQHLASLEEGEEPAIATAAAPAPMKPAVPSTPVPASHAITPARSADETTARFESMLIAARAASARENNARARHRPTLPREAPPDDDVEEQVRGLISLGVPR